MKLAIEEGKLLITHSLPGKKICKPCQLMSSAATNENLQVTDRFDLDQTVAEGVV